MNGSYFDEDNELTIKVVIIGNGAVGKSSLIQRYCRGIFTNQYKKTIGVDFLERTIDVNTQRILLMCWDTAGQEEFDALTSAYYRGAHACIIAFSSTDRESFNSVTSWHKKIEYHCGLIPTILVQNKIDLLQHATVNRDEVNELSARLRLPLFLTSSKENINIENAFYFLAKSYIESLNVANVIDSPAISSNKKFNNFLSNKPSQQNQHRKMPLRPVNDHIRINANLYKSNLKNCWPAANALIINNNLENYNTTGKPKLVIGRNHLAKPILPIAGPPNHYYNRTLNKPMNQSTNCHYLTTQSGFLSSSSSHYLANHQNKGRYFLLQNSNPINLSDNMYYTCYNNDYLKLKEYPRKSSKFSFKNGLFSKCRIL